MPDKREIDRLNTVFARELGRNKYGEPNYRWQWSETFMHHMVLEGKREWKRKPLMPEGRELGSIIAPNGAGLYVPEPVTQLRKMCPWLHDQWLISKFYWASEPEWRAQFGTTLEWPRRGFYLPVDNTDLPHGIEPTLHITSSFVDGMRTQLSKTRADFDKEVEDGMAREEKNIDTHIDDVLGDAMTAFGSAKPGSRAGGVSVPTPQFSNRYQDIEGAEPAL